MDNSDTSEQQEPRFRIPLWAWAAAIVAILFFALTLWQAQRLQRQLTELQLRMRLEQGRRESLEAQRREVDQIRVLLAVPETLALKLKPLSELNPVFKIFWNEKIGLLLTSQNVPAIPAGRVLQLWIVPKKGDAISAGVFQPEANGTVLKLTRPAAPIRMNDAAALTVTVEPVGGSPQPTSTPTWVGRIN